MSRTLAIAALASAALAAAGALAGCTKARTEAVVIVATDGVRVPDDIDAITLVVADASDATNPVFTHSFAICGGAITDNCYTLPLDFTLVPGPHREHSSRVQITATRHTMPVIDDASIFTFAEGESLRLDFVLYANCIGNTDCASRDQACGPDAMCHPLPANPMSGEPDLSVGPADLAVADDLAMPPIDLATPPIDLATPPTDLAAPVDLSLPRDMSLCTPTCAPNFCGLSNCGTPCTCGATSVCQASVCVTCGALGQPCCTGSVCTASGVSCNVGTNVCEQSSSDGGTASAVLTWSQQSLDSGALYGVWGVAGTVFAVGNFAGQSAVFINTSATTSPLAFTADSRYSAMGTLVGVSGRSASDVYAVGPSGVVVHFDGSSWSDANAGLSVNVNGVWAGGPNDDAWAVGGSISTPGNDPYGYAHHNSTVFPTGTHWSTTSGLGRSVQSAWGDGSGFVILVADETSVMYSTTNGGSFNGIAIAGTNNPLYSVFGFSQTQMYGVGGNGAIWRFNYKASTMILGSGQQTLSPTTSATLYGVGGSSATDLWAVGSGNSIYHSTGDGTWTKQTNLPTPDAFTTFRAVYALGPNDVYVVGNIQGSKVILHGQ